MGAPDSEPFLKSMESREEDREEGTPGSIEEVSDSDSSLDFELKESPLLETGASGIDNQNDDGGKEEEEENDGFKTPTSSEHRIPAMLQCPPAPMKKPPKRVLAKRKVLPGRKLIILTAEEIRSWFPPAAAASPDRARIDNAVKRSRKE